VHAPTLPVWQATWLADFLEKLPLARTVAVGWSLGGMLLLEALAERRLRPASLVLVGVAAVFCRRGDHPWGQPPAAVRAMRRALWQEAGRVLVDFAAGCLAPGEESFREEVTALFPNHADAGHLAAGLDYLLAADLRPQLSRLSGPTLLVQGGADRIVLPEQTQFLHEHLPGSRLITFPGAGHVPFITQAARFNEILKEVVGEGRGNAVPPPSPTPPPIPL